jgi:hypothetical protein
MAPPIAPPERLVGNEWSRSSVRLGIADFELSTHSTIEELLTISHREVGPVAACGGPMTKSKEGLDSTRAQAP